MGSRPYAPILSAEGGDVNNRVEATWAKWREVSGVMCNEKMLIKLHCPREDNRYKTIVKPAMVRV